MIDRLNRSFESRVRIGIMAVLVVNDWVDHATLRRLLEVTDGNLASHLNGLEQAGFVQVRKRFVGKRPNTSYRVTASGRSAFQAHLDAIQELLKTDLKQ
mgnify:CR=1 FL=1